MKVYGGEDALFGLLNPLVVLLGIWRSIDPPEARSRRVLGRAEQDGQRLANEGYRVVSSDWYAVPILGIRYLRVTYERAPAVR